MTLQILAEQRHAARDALASRGVRDSQPPRERAVGESLLVPQHEGGSIGLAQLQQTTRQSLLQPHGLELVLGRAPTGFARRTLLVEPPQLVRAMSPASEVRRDRRQPGTQAPLGAGLAVALFERGDQGVLDDVFGRIRVAHDAARQGAQPVGLREEQLRIERTSEVCHGSEGRILGRSDCDRKTREPGRPSFESAPGDPETQRTRVPGPSHGSARSRGVGRRIRPRPTRACSSSAPRPGCSPRGARGPRPP